MITRQNLGSFRVWPKVPPVLTDDQLRAREAYMKLWHEQLPNKYGIIEKFNHGFPAGLPHRRGIKTLEVGAGLGSHARYENLSDQEYHCLEYREDFCKEIAKVLPAAQVHCGNIEDRQPWPDETFDRVIAIHVLEHLRDLPRALGELKRLLKPDGVLDIVIPCEGGIAHTLARKVSAQRLFEKTFQMSFAPIHLNEHVNTFYEISAELDRDFKVQEQEFFPLKVPVSTVNLCAGLRLVKRR